MRVVIIYDDRALPGYRAGMGFACIVEGRERILFDTGADADVLAYNMRRAQVNPADLDMVVLSHQHWDHVGGLPYINDRSERAVVFALPSFASGAALVVPSLAVREVDAAGELSADVVTTGPVAGEVTEQAMGLRTNQGILMITGCAHPGVDRLASALSRFGKVMGVLGGFHDFARLDALKGLALVGPCHCSRRRKDIAARFPKAYCDVRAGTILQFAPAGT